MFSDTYLEKEDNSKIKDVLFEYLMAQPGTPGGQANFEYEGDTKELVLNQIDAEDPDISDYNMIPDTCKLSDNLRVCLQESDEVSSKTIRHEADLLKGYFRFRTTSPACSTHVSSPFQRTWFPTPSRPTRS